jgi:hypothetical protein
MQLPRSNGDSLPVTRRECDQRWGQLHEWIMSIDARFWGILIGLIVLLIGIVVDILLTFYKVGI